jgi:hypothetical protein
LLLKKIPIAACVLQLSQKICCPFVLLLLETEQESAIVALLVPLMLAYFVISFLLDGSFSMLVLLM